VEKRKYGGTGYDNDDQDSEEENDPKFVASTPMTKKRMHDEKE